MSRIAELIPGTDNWPTFERNLSEQYEARFVMVEVEDKVKNNSIFLQNMKGSKLPIVVAHGEGRAQFKNQNGENDFELMLFVTLITTVTQPTFIHSIQMVLQMVLLVLLMPMVEFWL